MLQIVLWDFVVFSFLGWFAGVFRIFIIEKNFLNNAFLTLPFCPMYGLSAVICNAIMKQYSDNVLVLFAGSMFVLSGVVVIYRFFLKKFLKLKSLNFTFGKFNFFGYISLSEVFLLGVIGFLLVGIFIPAVNTLIIYLPETVRNGIIYSLIFIREEKMLK